MTCVYLHSAVVRAASLKYPSVLRKGVDSSFKVQWFSSSHQLNHLYWHTSTSLSGCLGLSYMHTREGSYLRFRFACRVGSLHFFFVTVMTGYIWKSEKSHKAEPQSKWRRDILSGRLRLKRKQQFPAGNTARCWGFCSLGDGLGQKGVLTGGNYAFM